MTQNKLEDIASTRSLKIIGVYLIATFSSWILINFMGDKIAGILPGNMGRSILIFLELMFFLVTGIIGYYFIYKQQLSHLKTDDRLSFIFDENPNPLLVFEKVNFKIRDANKEAMFFLDCPEAMLESAKLLEFIYSGKRENFSREFNTYTEDAFFMRDVRMTRKKGEDIYCNLHFKCAEDGLVILSIYDITPLIQLKYNFSLLLVRHKQFETQIGDQVRTQFNYISNTVHEVENQLKSLPAEARVSNEMLEISRKINELDKNFLIFANQFNSMYSGLTESVKQIDLNDFNL